MMIVTKIDDDSVDNSDDGNNSEINHGGDNCDKGEVDD